MRQAKVYMHDRLAGKKSRLKRTNLIDYFGRNRLGLTVQSIEQVLQDLGQAESAWHDLLDRSFLSPTMKSAYNVLLQDRLDRLLI